YLHIATLRSCRWFGNPRTTPSAVSAIVYHKHDHCQFVSLNISTVLING
uniref:Uncharacterized protein n=1 Tax=Ascaris lumbricoides TaxID=6252 RepID=A0A0M3HF96_ASCLU